jgi:hypothetical protein
VLGVAATRLTSASLVPGGELCASTAAEPASAGLSCRGGRTFSARSRAHSGPTSDASSPAAFRPIPRCGHGFLAADLDRFHRCRVERQRFPRSETPSIDKEPGRLFTLVSSVFRNGTSDHDASSPIADSPRRARPCPPLSAATENGFLDPTPLADFCNHFHRTRAHQATDHSSHEARHFGALRCPGGTEAASGTAPGSPFEATRLASEDAGRTGRQGPRQLARGGARGRLEYLPSTSCRRPVERGT